MRAPESTRAQPGCRIETLAHLMVPGVAYKPRDFCCRQPEPTASTVTERTLGSTDARKTPNDAEQTFPVLALRHQQTQVIVSKMASLHA